MLILDLFLVLQLCCVVNNVFDFLHFLGDVSVVLSHGIIDGKGLPPDLTAARRKRGSKADPAMDIAHDVIRSWKRLRGIGAAPGLTQR